MPTDGGLSRRFLLAFILQALLISVTAVLGIWLARFVLEDVLIEQALEQEAAWFWAQRSADADAAPPRARNISGYFLPGGADDAAASASLPAYLRGYDPGLHVLDTGSDLTALHVSRRGDGQLYLVFDGQGVDLLTTYFGLAPLALVLVALYLTAFLGYRATHQVLSPLTALAREIAHLDVERIDLASLRQHRFVGDPDEEVAVLAGALADFTERLHSFIERERNFTRDASHELRSPLTVIGMAAEQLAGDAELPERARANVARIQRAVRDMRELVEAFLLLARETDVNLGRERVCVNELVADEFERARITSPGRVQMDLEAEGVLFADAPRQVLGSLIGNIVRNAVAHGDGVVHARVEPGALLIEDRGPGMAPDELARAFDPFFRGPQGARGGHGVGLTIVRRLSDRFGWPVSITSEPGEGTVVRVEFPVMEFERAADIAT